MAVIHRALLIWFVTLLFTVLAVLRLENRANWNWFIIFIPMWLFDGICVIYGIFSLLTHHRHIYSTESNEPIYKKVLFLASLVMKVTFQILLCLRLQYDLLALHYVMIPAWILLLAETINIGSHLRKLHAA